MIKTKEKISFKNEIVFAVGAGGLIDWIKFQSSDNIIYGPFGGDGGDYYKFSHPNCRLAYLSGRSGDWLDQLIFYFDCTPTTTTTTITTTTTTGSMYQARGRYFDSCGISFGRDSSYCSVCECLEGGGE